MATRELVMLNLRWFGWFCSLLIAIVGISANQRQYRWLLVVSALVLVELILASKKSPSRKVLEASARLGSIFAAVTLAAFGYPLGAILDYQDNTRSVNLFVSLGFSLIALGVGNGSVKAALNDRLEQNKKADTAKVVEYLDNRFASAAAEQASDMRLALTSIEKHLLELEAARKRRWWR